MISVFRIPLIFLIITFYSVLSNGSNILSHQQIASGTGDFTATFNDMSFGCAVGSIGDHNNDLYMDLVVGAYEDNDGGTSRGAVFVLFLEQDGTVLSHQKISFTKGGFTATGSRSTSYYFGRAVRSAGDINEDGIGDLVVGATGEGVDYEGGLYVIFLNSDATVKSHQLISLSVGGFTGLLESDDEFGSSCGSLGDMDGNDVNDVLVGAYQDDTGGYNYGSVYVIFLNNLGVCLSHQKISDELTSFTANLGSSDYFGVSSGPAGDINADGVADALVGAYVYT